MRQNENERENEKLDTKIKKSINIYNKIKKLLINIFYEIPKLDKNICSWKN
jgi:hypothetical protein